MGTFFVDDLAEIRLCGFALVFHRLAKASTFAVVVVLLVAQVRDQLIQAMINSDPRVRIVLVYRLNSSFHCIFTL